jgi:hypothetical protein
VRYHDDAIIPKQQAASYLCFLVRFETGSYDSYFLITPAYRALI